MIDRLLEPLSECKNEHWRVLGVLACEPRVTLSAIERLEFSIEVRPWFRQLIEQGLLLDAGIVYDARGVRGLTGERAVALPAEFRASVLRRLAHLGLLDELRQDGVRAFGQSTHSLWCAALHAGASDACETELAALARRQGPDALGGWIRSLLADALPRPFDSDWLRSVWRGAHRELVAQTLSDALFSLEPVDELHRWIANRRGEFEDPQLARILVDHAILRGDVELVRALTPCLPPAEQLPVRAVLSFVIGDCEASQHSIDELASARAPQRGSQTCASSVTALLCCLALSRGPKDGPVLARRLFQRYSGEAPPPISGWPVQSTQTGVGRGIRALLNGFPVQTRSARA
ncbi:MAG: hypothetical protein QM784_26285 [Polyangiaceae bacterium]